MGDVGLPLGAALQVAAVEGELTKRPAQGHVFFGPDYSSAEIESILRRSGLPFIRFQKSEEQLGNLIVQGTIVARFYGKTEYGPRALGNRSILCRPDDSALCSRLNTFLHRPYFMPYAPAVLAREANRCFENIAGAEQTARFMNIAFQATPWFKQIAPAVVHLDGSVRPQLLDETNASLCEIVEVVYRQTGIPCVLNTSFNLHGEPTICTPDDALRTFIDSAIDYLAIGNFLVSRPNRESTVTQAASTCYAF